MASTTQSTQTTQPTSEPKKARRWAPRCWLGCDFFGWIRLLARNRFAVGWQYSYIAVVDTIISVFNTGLRWLQTLIYGRRVRQTEISREPLFIIGHWRSGTTLLHELLSLDENHTYPTTYQCFSPNHFLLTERFAHRWLNWLMPEKRPMDNMAAGWNRPQEDEFALCNMGVPSPYLTIAFPNHRPVFPEYFNLEDVPAEGVQRWKAALLTFLRGVTYQKPDKRIVLKSPTHTCRVKTLLEMFPDARFVHIVRDPYVLFPSTMNVWRSLYQAHGLQKPNYQGLEEYVLETFANMHDQLERTRGLIDASRFYEVRYEDLTADPIGQMQAIYGTLELGDFAEVLPKLQEYVAATSDYKVNRYELTDKQREEIARRWKGYFERYGYPVDEPTVEA